MKKQKLIIKSILTILIFWYSPYLRLIPITLLHINANNNSDTMKVVLSCFSSLILVFIFYFLYRKELKKEFQIFKNNLLENIDIGFKYWIIGLIVMMTSNYIIRFILKGEAAGNEQAVQSMIKAFPLLMLIDGGLIGPFTEEIAFRKTLKNIFSNKWLFVISSFLLFGGAHVITKISNWTDILYIIPYGTLGGVFALSYYETDSIFTPMFMHIFHNLLLIILSIIIFTII